MGYFRFQKRVSIIPGVHVNVSKRGMSLSLGGPGASWNIGPRGQRTTLGLPVTGLSYIETTPRPATPAVSRRHRWLWVAFWVALFGLLWAIGAHGETVYCSTSFQGYRTCSSPGNTYRSFEWENGGRTYGDDNQGNKWTTTPGPWGDTTIIRRRGE
jgi:Protein of unknown function (DUF4236)